MASFTRFNFHAGERGRRSLRPHEVGAPPDLPGFGAAVTAEVTAAAESITFHNDEAAARHYLDALWVPEEEGPLFDLTAPESPAVVPDLRLGSVQESPSTKTRLMHFDQRVDNVRVLGAKAVVELSPDRGLVSINAQIAGAPDVSPIATLSASDALAKVAAKAGVTVEALGAVAAPSLTYYQDDESGWHLVYEVRHIPVAPAEFLQALDDGPGHGLGASPRQETFDMTYLVDAHDGAVVVYFSEVPFLDLPVQCQGLDELGTVQHFFGFQNGAGFELRDPLRKIRTLDLGFGNLMTAPAPTAPVSHTAVDFQSINTAAVSAHVNAQRVFDFYNDLLKRDGVDDKGMELVSVVNCTYKPPGTQSWKNAVWYKQQMWYGQVPNTGGGFDSYSRYLDVIAHELTHGVTETTAGLKYLNESGALNESFSDIFGVIVKNLNGPHPGDPDLWDWELGSGLSAKGGPLRDLSDPARTGDPDHMTKYQHKPSWDDGGGVHTNSNIHNKAAFNVLTSKDANGSHHFAPTQAALLYYLTLTRLSAFATFSDVLATMQNVIRTFWAGQPAVAQEKVDAVVAAYASVGIT